MAEASSSRLPRYALTLRRDFLPRNTGPGISAFASADESGPVQIDVIEIHAEKLTRSYPGVRQRQEDSQVAISLKRLALAD